MREHSHNRRCAGLSIVEILVVIAIIGLLLGLILPSVMQAREASRQIACANHMKQWILAISAYHEANAQFPSALGMPDYGRDGQIHNLKQFSIFSRILPYIDQSTVYSSINFELPMSDISLFPSLAGSAIQANATASKVQLSTLLCPSDNTAAGSGWGGSNYRTNLGGERWFFAFDSPFMNGIAATNAASVRDGLSNTACLGEKLRGGLFAAARDPRRDMFAKALGSPHQNSESLSSCASIGSDTAAYSTGGTLWMVGSLSQTHYNHSIPPNSRIPDCILPLANPISGHLGARSNHLGGVQMGMLDGSVRFVKSGVDARTWQGLGTSNGGELPPSWD